MSSPYPVLDNRPIDHWKVTELKEELKRRKLTTKGLKDDLVKRLAEDLYFEDEQKEALLIERGNAEALRVETENADKNVDNGIDGVVVAEPDPSLGETAGNIVDSGVTQKEKADDVSIKVHTNDNAAALGHGDVKEGDTFLGSDSARVEANVVVHTTVVETITTISESVISEVALAGQHFPNTETQKENGNSKPHPKYEDSKPLLDGDVLMSKPKDEGIESTDRMAMRETSPLKNQVSEVSLTSGFQVKSDSISPDSVSINEKIEIKDNIIADNIKIELDIVKPEMVEPSSINVDPVPGESHPMDVEEPKEKKTYIEGKDDSNNAANTGMNKNNQTVDVGYSEKLNLDRSSGDDSMEEDLLETRQIDSKDDSDNVVSRGEKTEIPSANEETLVDVVGGGLSLDNDINVESMNHAAATLVNKENPIGMPVEKRKLNDQEGIGSNEPLKRQRRWNTESVKVLESQSLYLTPTTPKNAFQSTALKRNFSVSGSKSSEDTPKERVVPPSPKPPTKSLRIDHFVRPFTLKAVQELLGKTGTVAKFWMDQIKTHCFVTYSSVEEAIETRNAVYNLQWPPNGGCLLVAEFVEPREVTLRADAPQAPAAPVKVGPTTLSAPPAAAQHVPSPRQPFPRHQPLPPPPPLPSTNLSPPREHLPPPPPLPLDPPIVTLDDLFRKTKASPPIYYLPLSEKEVAAKPAAQAKKQQA